LCLCTNKTTYRRHVQPPTSRTSRVEASTAGTQRTPAMDDRQWRGHWRCGQGAHREIDEGPGLWLMVTQLPRRPISRVHLDTSNNNASRKRSCKVNTLYEAHCCGWLESSNMATNSSMSVLRTLCSLSTLTNFGSCTRSFMASTNLESWRHYMNQIAVSTAYSYQQNKREYSDLLG